MKTSEEVIAGQAIYSRSVLSIYDIWVLGISNSFIWKCPSSRILSLFNQHVSANHLDVGVGTGYFLDRCKFPAANPRVALMDLNENSLHAAAARISRYKPEIYKHNVLEPVTQSIASFDSISVNYLFHCLPGPLSQKGVLLDYLHPLLNENGVLFGSTILQGDVKRGYPARKLMGVYNKKGIFSNTQDDLQSLQQSLSKRYREFGVEVQGCVALFWGRK